MVAQNDALVRGFSAAVSGAVVDDEGFGPGGMHPDAKARELIIPGDPGFVRGLQRLDDVPGQGQLVQCDAFCGRFHHASIMARASSQWTRVSPAVQDIAQTSDWFGSPCVGPLRRIDLAGAPIH